MREFKIDFRAGGDLVNEPIEIVFEGRLVKTTTPSHRNYRVQLSNGDWSSWLTAHELDLILTQEVWVQPKPEKPGLSIVTALMTSATFNAKTSSDPQGKRLGAAVVTKIPPSHKALRERESKRLKELSVDDLMKELGL
jgi:hypothetical protein